MKIKEVHIDKFKRFTNLTIKNIPQNAKLVMLLGPNGCGKSSLFDAFKTWYRIRGYNYGSDDSYCKKDRKDIRNSYELVNIDFYENSKRLNFRHGYKNPRPHFCNRSTLTIHI